MPREKFRVYRRALVLVRAISACLVLCSVAVAQEATSQPDSTQPASGTQPTPIAATQPMGFIRAGEDEVRFNQGRMAYYNSAFRSAESAFQRCVDDNSNDAQAFYYMGLTLTAENYPALAIRSFDKALSIDRSLDEAKAGRASALIRLKRYDAARADIDSLASDPQWADTADYLRGQLAYSTGDYRSAAVSFEKAKSAHGSEYSAAGLYAGLSYIQLKELSRAQAAFRDVARIDRDSSASAAARASDYSLQNQDPGRPFKISIAAGYEYDSNVPLLEYNSPYPPGVRRQQDGRFIIQPQASLSLFRSSTIDVGVDTSDYFSWQNIDHAYEISSYQVGAFGTWNFAKNMFAGLRYDFNDLELGHGPFLKRNVVTPQFTYVEPSFGYTSAYYQFEARQFNVDQPTAALDRDGKANVLGVVQGIDLNMLRREGTQSPRLELGLRYENDQTSGTDFDGNFVTLSSAFFMPITRNWTGDAGFDISYFGYTHGNSLDASRRTRSDYEVKPRIGVTWQANQYVAVRADYTFIAHQSNVISSGIRPYQYNEHQLGMRVIFTY